MRLLPLVGRPLLVAAVSLLIVPVACEDATEPPVVPASLSKVSGDLQTDTVTALLLPLVVEVRDDRDAPASHVAVTWVVEVGGGSVASSSSVTGRDGRAQMSWTLGSTVGENRVRASVAGPDPVTFTAAATAGSPALLELDTDTVTFHAVGDTTTVSVSAADRFGNPVPDPAVTWMCEDTLVARMAAAGRVLSVGGGETRVIVRSGGVADTVVVAVDQVVEAVTVTPAVDTLPAGQLVQLSATASDSNGFAIPGTVFAWTSSDTTVATVDVTGRVAGRLAGLATISAEAAGVTGSADVVVEAGTVWSVDVSPDSARLTALGDTVRYDAAVFDVFGNEVTDVSPTWSVTDTLVATVDSSGLVTAEGNGTAGVVAARDGVEDTAVVVVEQVVTTVSVTPSADTVASGSTVQLTAEARDGNGEVVSGASFAWTSADTLVATVDAAGQVSGKQVGTATITAESGGVSDSSAVVVETGPVARVEVTPDSAELVALGDTVRLAATAYDAHDNVVAGTPTWSVTDTLVATVDSSGLVTAEGNGTAGVVAARDGVEDTAVVVVEQVAATVDIAPDSAVVAIGDTAQFTASVEDANGNALADPAVTWAILPSTPFATVDGNGLVTGDSVGTALLTATSGTASDTASVRVTDGVLRRWVGGSAQPTDWGDPSNWLPAGVPTAKDTVRVAGALTDLPVLDADRSVAAVQVDSSATLDVGGWTLTVSNDVEVSSTAEIVGSTGGVVMSGTGALEGTVTNLEITGAVTLDGATTVMGVLRLAGGTLANAGFLLRIMAQAF